MRLRFERARGAVRYGGVVRYGSVAGALVLSAALGTGCGDAWESEPTGQADGRLAHPGPWQIPEATLALGDSQYVEYTGAGPWQGEAGCSGGMTPGNSILREYLYAHFPQIGSIGGYSCRQNTGNTSQTSVHGTGRALDIMIPVVGSAGDADNDAGDPVGNWLIENAEAIGIQYIIWDQWTWNASRAAGAKDREYSGPNPHVDHLHVELSLASSTNTTNWFEGLVTPPAIPNCEPVPAEGRVIDERDSCFLAFGPTQYWRAEEGVGYDGSLLWTNAYDGADPSNWARWNLSFDAPGKYQVDVFIDPAFGVHTATEYAVTHGATEASVTLDQSAASGWVSLGEFEFDTGAAQHVSVFDTSVTDPGDDQHIAVDALRIVPVGSDPGTWPGGGGSGGSGGAPTPEPTTPEPDPGGNSGATVTVQGDSGCHVSSQRAGQPGNWPAWVLVGVGWLVGVRRRRATVRR